MEQLFERYEDVENNIAELLKASDINLEHLYTVDIIEDETCNYNKFKLEKAVVVGVFYLYLTDKYNILIRNDYEPGVASYLLDPDEMPLWLAGHCSDARLLTCNHFHDLQLPTGIRFRYNDSDINICNLINVLEKNTKKGYYIPYSIIKEKMK